MTQPPSFADKGWTVFVPEPAVTDWVEAALPHARQALIAHPDQLQCDGTWFVGLDVLPNDGSGRMPRGPALAGTAVDFATAHCGGWPVLHAGQLSVTYPGYPRPRAGETEAGFRYRLTRDAAHVDGIIGLGTPKRRFLKEPHAFVLGLPLTEADADAAPLVVWEGSHHLMRTALRDAVAAAPGDEIERIDVTQAYQAARRVVFEQCRRVVLHGTPGSVLLLHRHLLHGVAPWTPGAMAAPEGRMIAYFRPELPGGLPDWLTAP
ncbi:hypothetical protein [uncultured Roseobacter sp.]|uniref:hypothetical protein n=1 Tax=uncultured Roseobacter sp. TaxID=114847 RepID=UPI00260E3586|nr:hypothetical protein [uncultured Roseobacter sp.]